MAGTRTLWVTGASGFLGRHVARRFSDAGWSVAGLARGDWGATSCQRWGIETLVKANVEPASLELLAERASLPHCIFHAAGGSSVGRSIEDPLQDFSDSVVTTAAVLDFIRRNAPDATFVLPSSAAVYGSAPPGPIAETAPLVPVSPYGRHKRMAEELCAEASDRYGLSAIVIRYFSLYGPGLRKQLLWDIVRKSFSTATVELFGTGDETRDLLHCADAAALALRCVEGKDTAGLSVVNGGSGEALRVREIAERLVACLNRSTDIQFNNETRAGDPMHYQADTRRCAELGFAPCHGLHAGLAEYAAWACSHLSNAATSDMGTAGADLDKT